MKKALALLAMSLMVIGLTGCLDDPDGASNRGMSSPISIER
jgi:hypothetical protein